MLELKPVKMSNFPTTCTFSIDSILNGNNNSKRNESVQAPVCNNNVTSQASVTFNAASIGCPHEWIAYPEFYAHSAFDHNFWNNQIRIYFSKHVLGLNGKYVKMLSDLK